MRESCENEDLRGKICVCSIGRPGIVVGKANLGWGETWVGFRLDTHERRTWSSRKPLVLADSAEEFYLRSKRAYGEKLEKGEDGVYTPCEAA